VGRSEIAIVMDRQVADVALHALVLINESDDPQRRMRSGIEQVLFERHQAASQHLGLGGLELLSQAVEPGTVGDPEKYLHRRRLGRTRSPVIMRLGHES
jgi:hypothetical protein